MPTIGARQIGVVALVVLACLAPPVSSSQQGVRERASFAQSSAGSNPDVIGGRPPGGGFIVDFRRGFDRDTHRLSDWFMDAGWLKADFSPHNVRYDSNGMALAVKRRNGGPTRYVSAEFQYPGFYGYGRYEVVMRTANMAGVVSSFFTHTDGYFGDTHSEVDFEFVGGKPGEVHTNYFWDDHNDPADTPLGFDASKDFHLYAFEWLPNSIVWYADGVEVRRIDAATAPAPIPRTSARVVASVWAATDQAVEWVGEPAGPGASALYRCMSHVPVGRSGPQCSDTFTRQAR